MIKKQRQDASSVVVFLFNNNPPTNLRNRVASVTFEAEYDDDDTTYEYASHYNYDATGNVKTLIQEIVALHPNGHGFKRIDYDYDYISGNVNAVYYQRGQADQFSHRYEYDANNRLTNVYTNIIETNEPSHFWEEGARYEYYLHGPLARVEMGEQKVQGMDYAYNLQGWIKGVNSSALVAEKDMGQDGLDNTSPAKDALGYTLGYFNGDYEPINPAVNFEMEYDGTTLDQSSPSLYNGNIRNMIISNKKLGGTNGYVYQYDQLHRIKQMQTVKNPDVAGYTWGGSTLEDHFKTNYTYDPNGNLETLDRKDDVGADLDKLAYDYYKNTNRLKRVADNAVNSLSEEVEQVQHQVGNSLGINYLYDGAGNLIEDVQAYTKIKWTPYGKVDYVDYDTDENDSPERRVSYGYDAMQNRVVKSDYDRITTEENATYYFRDAQGNVMAIYERDASGTIKWKEQHLYGSSRLGILRPDVEWAADELPEEVPYYTSIRTATSGTIGLTMEGWKRYELSNHLGNVLSVVNDRKSYVDDDEDGMADYYEPAILSATDYYPFGMAMAGRTFSMPMPDMPGYRYGFNGKEKDKDLNGDLTHYDYGFRIYNAGIGKFLSVDPLMKGYPMLTPYQFASNRPINGIDLDGMEWVLKIYSPGQSSRFLDALNDGDVVEQRRITFYALNNEFVDENQAVNNWASESNNGPLNGKNTGASLEFDLTAKEGITVYLSGYYDQDENFTTDVTGNINFTDMIHFDWNKGLTPDKFFPVDVKLLNNDGTYTGDDYYGEYDFIGNTVLDFSINGMGKSFLSGRMRGFGYLEFQSDNYGIGMGGVEAGTGPITGKYTGPSMNVANPMGKLGFFIGEGKTNMLTGEWESSDENGNKMWGGDAPTIGVGTDLIPVIPSVNFTSTNYVKLLHQFTNSTKQKETITDSKSKRSSKTKG